MRALFCISFIQCSKWKNLWYLVFDVNQDVGRRADPILPQDEILYRYSDNKDSNNIFSYFIEIKLGEPLTV